MDFVFTVCDNAAGEVYPVWAGQPMTAPWGFEDPAAAEDSDEHNRDVLSKVFRQIANRVQLFINLSIEKLDKLSLQKEIREIGKR